MRKERDSKAWLHLMCVPCMHHHPACWICSRSQIFLNALLAVVAVALFRAVVGGTLMLIRMNMAGVYYSSTVCIIMMMTTMMMMVTLGE